MALMRYLRFITGGFCSSKLKIESFKVPSTIPSWDADCRVGLRVWVERSGHAILGKGRLELLEAINRGHSISEAARQMGMSYRRAWLLVQRMNEASGEPLVTAVTGGSHGGGARLTPLGQRALSIFGELQYRLHLTAAALLSHLVQAPTKPSIHVAAAVSLEEVLGQLVADFSLLQPAVRVRAIFAASDELADHLLAGAPGDLFLTADGRQLGRLKAAALLGRGAGTVLAENRLVLIARADRPVQVRKPADLVRSDVKRIALAEPTCPLGGYTRTYLNSLGLLDRLTDRTLPLDNSRSVVTAVRAGHAEVGLVYGSDAANAAGCRLLFRAGRTLAPIQYQAAVLAQGHEPQATRAFLRFLTSRRAARRFRRCGFIPPRSALT
jgi:molybdate transport system substrate-binding protein